MKIRTIIFLLFLLPMPLLAESAYAENGYVLGRAPQLSANIISQLWTPFVEFLSKQTDNRITLKVYSDRNDFEKDLRHGMLDFYYGNPGYAVFGHERYGYKPLVRSGNRELKGILLVHKNSTISSVEQLNGKTLSFPGENAFAASKYLRAKLHQDINLDFVPRYLNSHDDVYRSVVNGKYPAGGGVVRTLEREPEALQSQLRIIYETPGLASHPLMVHPRVPYRVQIAVQTAILDLVKTKTGKTLLKQVNILNPVKAKYYNDYAPVSKLAHEMYSHLFQD